MPTLPAALLAELDTLTDGLIGGQLSPVEWHNAVARELFAHHLAAYAAASGMDERAALPEVKRIVGKQIDYLNGFTDAIEAGRYTDKADVLKARAALYTEALKFTEIAGRWGEWEIPEDLMPGNQTCMVNCKCEISVKDHGDGTGTLTRVMHAEQHCDECPPLAGDHPIERRKA